MKTAESLIASSRSASRRPANLAGPEERGRATLQATGPRLPTKKPADEERRRRRVEADQRATRSVDQPPSAREARAPAAVTAAMHRRGSTSEPPDARDEDRAGRCLVISTRPAAPADSSRRRSSASARAGSGRQRLWPCPEGVERRRVRRRSRPRRSGGQRGWNQQALGGLIGLGTSPSSTICFRGAADLRIRDRHRRAAARRCTGASASA
mgnify:CR=1 FL=1